MDRIDRLVKLADVWCAIHFFHPWLGYRKEIDWDAALVAAIPAVSAAKDTGEFAIAVGDMLKALGDPLTRIRLKPDDIATAALLDTPEFCRRLTNGVLVLCFRTYGQDWSAMLQDIASKATEFEQADNMVFDLRGSNIGAFCIELSGLDNRLSTASLIGPGTRSRRYRGYVPQRGATSGGYNAAFVVVDGKLIEPHKTARDMACVFIVDAVSELPSVALALQRAGKAAIMVEGGPEVEPLAETVEIEIGDGLSASIRTSELVHDDGTGGFAPDFALQEANSDALIDAALAWLKQSSAAVRLQITLPALASRPRDRDYAEMGDPSLEYRMLGAFRIWGTLNYFFPYKALIGESWNSVLRSFVPRFEAARDGLEYVKAVAEMVAHTGDSHCFVGSKQLNDFIGQAQVPARVQLIDGVPVVVAAYGTTAGAPDTLAVGDVVRTVDGVDAVTRMRMIAPYYAASTPQSLDWRLAQRLLCGVEDSCAHIVVERDGKEHGIGLQRAMSNWNVIRSQRGGEVMRFIDAHIGYADLDRLKISEVEQMFEMFRDTKAIIFDMRGYPYGTAWPIASRLARGKGIIGARFECPLVGIDMLEDTRRHDHPAWQPFLQMIPDTDKWRYEGRTMMLLDETAISQSEHTALFLKAANGTIMVGSPTTGANGDVTNFVIPGGIKIGFTGQAVMYADGRQLQRVGVVPDIPARPTLAGIRAGRDEVLEKAIAALTDS